MKQALILLIFSASFFSCTNREIPISGEVNIVNEQICKSIVSKEFGSEDTTALKSEIFKVFIDEKKSAEFTTVSVPTKSFFSGDTLVIQTGNPKKIKTTLPDYFEKYQLLIFNGKYKFRPLDMSFKFPYLDKYVYEYYPLSINKLHPISGDTLIVNTTIKRTGIANTGYNEITYYKFEIKTVLK
jgi:hypothetical protein